ncbi:hypothetical protein [Helicobacter macacae]|uniref:hypothetical protein n=1 Tax=Helicobacter macacae TaxID=398626 RepID=UPI00040FF94B|nr:hypothetical protein [Helicobacter macacae]
MCVSQKIKSLPVAEGFREGVFVIFVGLWGNLSFFGFLGFFSWGIFWFCHTEVSLRNRSIYKRF